MGSFNVGCGISNLSIDEGDKIGFLLLGNAPDYSSKKHEFPPTYSMRIYNTDDYLPFLPPVFGEYDDYGRIANLTESVTTKVIEEIFRRPAEAVLNAAGHGGNLYALDDIDSLYMPEHIFKVLRSYGTAEAEEFKTLGFTVGIPEAGYTARYDYKEYAFQTRLEQAATSSFPFERYSWDVRDTKLNKLIIEKFNAHSQTGTAEILSAFAFETKILPGYAEEDWEAILLLNSLSGMFFLEDVYLNMDTFLWKDKYRRARFERFEGELTKFIDEIPEDDTIGFYTFYSGNDFVGRHTALDSGKYLPYLRAYAGTKEYHTISRVVAVAANVNRMLQPSYNGEQFGDNAAAQALNRVTNAVLKERRKSYEE